MLLRSMQSKRSCETEVCSTMQESFRKSSSERNSPPSMQDSSEERQSLPTQESSEERQSLPLQESSEERQSLSMQDECTIQCSSLHINEEAKRANFTCKKGKILQRSHSAPTLIFAHSQVDFEEPQQQKSSTLIVKGSFICLFLYALIGVTAYLTMGDFKGTTTYRVLDAIYFTMVTLCTVGYGDIVPNSTLTKMLTSVFMLVGFGIICFLLNSLVPHICHSLERYLLNMTDQNKYKKFLKKYMVDEEEEGRVKSKTKFFLALTVVISCISTGAITMSILENLSWEDSIYLSITSLITVGYGDLSIKTEAGRWFAIIWLLVSTLAVAKSFIYFTEYHINERNRNMQKWVLQKKITVSDLMAADLDNDGSIRMPEFIIYKLKQMGKISHTDIQPIINQFDSFQHGTHGRITLSDLIETNTCHTSN